MASVAACPNRPAPSARGATRGGRGRPAPCPSRGPNQLDERHQEPGERRAVAPWRRPPWWPWPPRRRGRAHVERQRLHPPCSSPRRRRPRPTRRRSRGRAGRAPSTVHGAAATMEPTSCGRPWGGARRDVEGDAPQSVVSSVMRKPGPDSRRSAYSVDFLSAARDATTESCTACRSSCPDHARLRGGRHGRGRLLESEAREGLRDGAHGPVDVPGLLRRLQARERLVHRALHVRGRRPLGPRAACARWSVTAKGTSTGPTTSPRASRWSRSTHTEASVLSLRSQRARRKAERRTAEGGTRDLMAKALSSCASAGGSVRETACDSSLGRFPTR